MLKENDRIRLSASDLMRFMSCAHASRLDLERLHGGGPEPAADSEDAELLQRHGDAHEAAHLDALRSSGDVTEIETEQPFPEAVQASPAIGSRTAMRTVIQIRRVNRRGKVTPLSG